MSDATIQVILERIDNLKEHVNEKFKTIEKQFDNKCDTCTNAPTFRERLRSQWTHICAIWAVLAAIVTYFYNHIGKVIP